MIRLLSAAVGLSLWCAACASSGTETPPAPLETPAPTNTGLGEQTLAPGECGLFLWTRSEPRVFVFFSKAGSQSALVFLDGEQTRMPQTRAEGEIFGQFMTDLQFAPRGGDGTLSVMIEPGELLEQGQRTESARLTFTNAEGWETIVPVAGVRACQIE